MDRAEPPAPLDGYALDEREPSLVATLWQGPVEPVRAVRCEPVGDLGVAHAARASP